jgi:prepilin-type N-terminal cleavage/methylation domain-containing protein
MGIRSKTNRGVTLIELLIALVISSFLIAALYRVFISQQQTYTVQEQVVDMQQNARASISRMMSEIRMAGFGNVTTVLPVQFTVYGQTRTFNNVLNPDTPVAASLTIVSAIQRGATITENASSNQNQIKVSSLADFDKDNKKYVSIGGLESHVITDIDTVNKRITLSGNLIYNHGQDTPVFPIRAISYQVVQEDGNTTLKRDENIGGGRQPLADNIENTQFEYFDSNSNPTATPSNIRMVKVTVKARTDMPDPNFKGGELADPLDIDKGAYRIREISSNVFLRNMGLSQ